MLSNDSQRVLSELLMKIIEGERKIEILRKCLCENFEFNPRVLFKSLSKVFTGSILARDLKDFLDQNSELFSDQDVYLVVKQYSSLQNSRLTEEDFSHFVLTATDLSLASLAETRYHVTEVKAGVRYSFLSLIKEEIKFQQETDHLKTKLFQDPEFSLSKAFETLNQGSKGYIVEAEVIDFLQKYKRYIGPDDFDALMRRIDLEDDLVISYNEFLEALMPVKIPKLSVESKSNDFERIKDSTEFSPSRLQNTESEFYEAKDKEESKTKSIVINDEQDSKDEPFETHELEKSPRFRNSGEVNREEYETPEKSKSINPKHQSFKSKSSDFSQSIIEILIQHLHNERKLEHARQNLLMQENFSISQAFKLIDQKENNLIVPYDLDKFLEKINLKSDKPVIISIIKRYGNKETLTLDPDDIVKIVLPKDSDYSSLLKQESDQPLTQMSIEKFRDVLEIIVDFETALIEQQETLGNFSEEELKEFFTSLDYDDDGEISSEDLNSFFKKLGLNVSEKDRHGLIGRFTAKNQTIYFNEFKALILDQ
jgi:Ca2+-binding EF-hand superfamily protein